MTVQDALPVDDRWLERLLEGFDDDNVAAVCGQQIVRRDPKFNPVQWFRPVSEPVLTKYSFADVAGFQALPAAEKRAVCGFDNVNTMYLRAALLKVPFQQMGFAEDIQWAKDAILSGYTIAYNYAAGYIIITMRPRSIPIKGLSRNATISTGSWGTSRKATIGSFPC